MRLQSACFYTKTFFCGLLGTVVGWVVGSGQEEAEFDGILSAGCNSHGNRVYVYRETRKMIDSNFDYMRRWREKAE